MKDIRWLRIVPTLASRGSLPIRESSAIMSHSYTYYIYIHILDRIYIDICVRIHITVGVFMWIHALGV